MCDLKTELCCSHGDPKMSTCAPRETPDACGFKYDVTRHFCDESNDCGNGVCCYKPRKFPDDTAEMVCRDRCAVGEPEKCLEGAICKNGKLCKRTKDLGVSCSY